MSLSISPTFSNFSSDNNEKRDEEDYEENYVDSEDYVVFYDANVSKPSESINEPISYDDSFESDSSEDDNLPIKIPQKVNIEDEFTNEKKGLSAKNLRTYSSLVSIYGRSSKSIALERKSTALPKRNDSAYVSFKRQIRSSVSCTRLPPKPSVDDANKVNSENIPNKEILKKESELKPIRSESFTKSTCSLQRTSFIQHQKLLEQQKLQEQQQQQEALAESKKEKFLNKSLITVDTSKARSNSEVLKICLAELGWQDCPNGLPHGCDIIWQSCTSHEGEHNSSSLNYSNTARVNKFPCMNQLLRKGPLTLSLNVMRKLFEPEYDFYPRTWFLPEQLAEFTEDCRYIHEKQLKRNQPLTTFIVKPNDGSQGDGIYLIKDHDDYIRSTSSLAKKNSSKCHIVQEYIHNPFLIDGLKFDLRIYVVIVNLKPLEIYICDEGLVRFATVNYQYPDDNNLNQIFMHLTNYSLNKKNESYKFTSDKEEESAEKSRKEDSKSSGQGSKRKLTRVFNYMSNRGLNVNKIKAEIDNLVVKTVLALLPEMKIECAFENVNKQRPTCFQILGFDILLKDNLKPVLLEVNCNPSLRIDYEIETKDGKILQLQSPIDLDIKKPLVLETLKLVAPKKKLELIEKNKREEEYQDRATKFREYIVKQRMEERLISAQKTRKFENFDINKFPLLSKPGEQYKKRFKEKNIFSTTLSIVNKLGNNEIQRASTAYRSSKNYANMSENMRTIKSLRNIYPNRGKINYNHLFTAEQIADIFNYFTLSNGLKTMTHSDFRDFVKKCNLITKKLTADNLDIIYFDLNKKWELYNRKKLENKGLCYQGFVECFMKLSKLIFDEISLRQSVKSLLFYCKYHLKQDNFKYNQYFEPESDDILLPITNKLIESIAFVNTSEPKFTNSSQVNLKAQTESSSSFAALNEQPKASKELPLTNGNGSALSRKPSKKSLFPIFFDTNY